MHEIIKGHADQNQRSTDKREGNLNYKEGTGKTLRKSFICQMLKIDFSSEKMVEDS